MTSHSDNGVTLSKSLENTNLLICRVYKPIAVTRMYFDDTIPLFQDISTDSTLRRYEPTIKLNS